MTITCGRKRTHGVHSQNTEEHLISYVTMNGIVVDSMMWCFRWMNLIGYSSLTQPTLPQGLHLWGWSEEGQVTIYIINVR